MPSSVDDFLSAVRIHGGTTTSASTFVETETVILPDGRYETRVIPPRSSNVVVNEIDWEEEQQLQESYIPPPIRRPITQEEFQETMRMVREMSSFGVSKKPRIDIPEIDDKDQISF